MSLRHVGSALVMDGDRLLGIFTERDIVRALASDFDAAGHIVDASMTRDPRTLPGRRDRRARHDARGGFRHLPVTDGDRIVGIVSLRDLAPR